MKILKTIIDIIFPLKCIICNSKGSSLCLKCLNQSSFNQKEIDSFIYPIYDYKDKIIKKAIWSLKYKNKKDIAEIFADILYKEIIEEIADLKMLKNFNNPIIIPIPLSRKRQKERGYNQSLLIAESLVKIDKNKNFELAKNILIKTKETIHQAKIKNRKERLENLINTFKVINKEKIRDRNIILIDDVVTTSATIKEAKKELRKNGARKIIAFTIAH